MHDPVLRKKASATLETVVRRLLRIYDVATDAERDAGINWYPEAGEFIAHLGATSGHGRDRAAAVTAHLSPRMPWHRNVAAAIYLLTYGERMDGVIGRSYEAARQCLTAEDPVKTFTGPKTERFCQNLLGNLDVVTVDVWAARAAGVAESQLYRVGVYEALEHAYRLAARRRNIPPAAMQSTTWVVTRGGNSGTVLPPGVLSTIES